MGLCVPKQYPKPPTAPLPEPVILEVKNEPVLNSQEDKPSSSISIPYFRREEEQWQNDAKAGQGYHGMHESGEIQSRDPYPSNRLVNPPLKDYIKQQLSIIQQKKNSKYSSGSVGCKSTSRQKSTTFQSHMKEEEHKIPFIEQSKVLVEISREPKAGPAIS